MNYYEHHLGDWAAATGHLTWDEDMAYTRLLRAYYHGEKAIPQGQQYRLAKATTPAQRKAVDAVLAEFFQLVEGHFHQKRADEEIARFQDKKRKAAASANARWSQSERNANASPPSMRTHSERNADGMLSSLQSPDTKHQTPEPRSHAPSESNARVVGFDSDWLDSIWPPTANNRNSATAIHHAMALVNLGLIDWTTLRQRVEGFAQHCATGGYSDPAKVPGMVNWFRHDHPERYWSRDWAAVPTKAEQQQDANRSAAMAFLNRNRGAA